MSVDRSNGKRQLSSEDLDRSSSSSRESSALLEDTSPDINENMTMWQVIVYELGTLKWKCLPLMCLMGFGSSFINDFPGSIGTGFDSSIQARFKEYGKPYTQQMNQVLYSVYSYPNVVLCVLGGLLIDKYLGIRMSCMLFISLIFLGSLLFYLGVLFVNYPLIVASRLVYGLGGESLSVGGSAYTARYFAGGRGIAIAFSISVSVSRIGSSFTFMFSPLLANRYGICMSVAFGVIACGISLASTISMTLIDLYAERTGQVEETMDKDDPETIRLSDIPKLPSEVWILGAVCTFCYCCIIPFNGIAENFFEVKFDVNPDTAARDVSFYMYSGAIAGPILGTVADKTGRYPIWCIAATCAFILVHILALLTPTPPYIVTIMLGVPISALASGVWPSIPCVVQTNVVGLCYGLITSLQNIGLATWPAIVGAILTKYTPPTQDLPSMLGYGFVELFLVLTGVLAIIVCGVLVYVDRLHGGILMQPPSARVAVVQDMKADLESRRSERRSTTGGSSSCGSVDDGTASDVRSFASYKSKGSNRSNRSAARRRHQQHLRHLSEQHQQGQHLLPPGEGGAPEYQQFMTPTQGEGSGGDTSSPGKPQYGAVA